MTQLDKSLVQQRVIVRDKTRDLIAYGWSELAEFPPAAQEVYFEELRDYAAARLPAPSATVPRTARQELTAEEARHFERTKMPFGVYQGETIDRIMSSAEGREYLAWVADQRFIDQLRLYLRRQEIRRELADGA